MIEYANQTTEPVTVGLSYDNSFIEAALSFTTLQPTESGTLNINLNTATCKQWGPVESKALVIVNGKEVKSEEYAITLNANIIEDFSQMTVQERQQAPIVEIPAEINLGKVKAGQKMVKKVPFKNAGVNPLYVRAIVGQDETLQATAQKSVVKGGKSGNLVFNINATSLEPTVYRRQIEFITNDPLKAINKITIVWTVE